MKEDVVWPQVSPELVTPYKRPQPVACIWTRHLSVGNSFWCVTSYCNNLCVMVSPLIQPQHHLSCKKIICVALLLTKPSKKYSQTMTIPILILVLVYLWIIFKYIIPFFHYQDSRLWFEVDLIAIYNRFYVHLVILW